MPPDSNSKGISAVAHRRHKRETNARRLPTLTGSRAVKVAAGAAALVTVPAVGLGVVAADPPTAPAAITAAERPPIRLDPPRHDSEPVTRSFDRAAARAFQHGMVEQQETARAVRQAHVRKWTTTDLNLWSSASPAARQVGLVPAARQVLVTGRSQGGRVEVVVDGQSRWVTAGYLADHKPQPAPASASSSAAPSAPAGLSMAPCPDPSVENGLTAGAVYVYRSVCHAFPQITSYGGWAARGEHSSGKALDIMTTDKALGDQIAAFLQAHAAELNLFDVIWWDRIWTPVRAAEGWRPYGDHGSPTANHMDHVHVSVN
jgi:hypothetical protein